MRFWTRLIPRRPQAPDPAIPATPPLPPTLPPRPPGPVLPYKPLFSEGDLVDLQAHINTLAARSRAQQAQIRREARRARANDGGDARRWDG